MSEVALVRGNSIRENVSRSFNLIAKDMRKKIGEKTVLIKPNCTSCTVQKATTHVDQLRGILDFLSPFYTGKVIIAEATDGVGTTETFRRFGYLQLKQEYPLQIEFLDLNKDHFEEVSIPNGELIRLSRTVLEPSLFIISAAKLKTHNLVVATLSIKNLLVGAILGNEKTRVHSKINRNLLHLARMRMPDAASIDAFYGMDGEGPIDGEVVRCEVAIASTDPLAADRVGLEIMGISSDDVGYLVYCSREKLGEYDLDNINLVGAGLDECRSEKPFRLHSTIEDQLRWKTEEIVR